MQPWPSNETTHAYHRRYLARLIENPRVTKYLREHHREIALEFIRIVERQATAS